MLWHGFDDRYARVTRRCTHGRCTEDENCQVRPGAFGEAGQDNRRVGLIVDYAGPRTSALAT